MERTDLCQSVDTVIEKEEVHVDVTTYGVDEVVTADSSTVAVTGDDPYGEVRVSEFHACSYSCCTAVDAVESVCVHIIWEA